MGDMLSTGLSGLLAFQNALDTISNNVTNVDTPGYSRQTTNLVTNPSTPTAEGTVGNGVSVANTTRSYSDFLDAQTRAASSSVNQYSALNGLANTLNNMFADPTTGLSATLQNLSQSLQTLANSPTQSASRSAVVNQLQGLVAQFQGYQNTFNQLNTQVNGRLQSEASTVTSLSKSIAGLNAQIAAADANGTGQPPNDLLDQRNNLIDQLSQEVNVSTVTQSDGSINVFIGNGQALVVGNQATSLVAVPDQFGSGRTDLAVQVGKSTQDITNALSGGTIGGLLQFRTQMLDPGRNALGQAAVTLSNLLNAQNAAGLDANGNVGGALLTVGGPQILASTSNTGNAQVSGAITSLGALTTDDYGLSYNGTAWTLNDSTTGASIALTASTSGGVTTLTGGAGLTLSVTGIVKAGDQFLVTPTGNALTQFGLATTDPSKIAAAGPLVTGANGANTGTASINASVPNTSAYTRGNYTLSFGGGPLSYTVKDAGGATVASGTYTAGTPITFNGISVTVSGTPAAADSFTIDDNANGVGDNSNALLLAGVINQNALNNGTESLSGAVSAYVGNIGLQTSQAQNGLTAQQSVLNSAQSAQQSVQGVNLDEEAAKMVQFQQAYQAAAQIIATSNALFSSIINAMHAA
jgi:flagellar hook-associated protein 1 FlgK